MRIAAIAILFGLTSTATFRPAIAADFQVDRDVAYTDPADPARTLDAYYSTQGADHPLIVWVHGGGWRRGDKGPVGRKPRALVDRGYVFASVNYRFVPQVEVPDQAADVAAAVRFLHDHAADYGADPERSGLMGHSTAADLVAIPSRWEGMPNVLLEAIALERPFVVTDVEGVREVLGNIDDRQLPLPGDAPALADALCSAIGPSSTSHEQALALRQRLFAEFSGESMVEKYEELYRGLLTQWEKR